jgi:hypothetical protein
MDGLRGKSTPRLRKVAPALTAVRSRFPLVACSLSAHGTVALCGYRRANLKKEKEKH